MGKAPKRLKAADGKWPAAEVEMWPLDRLKPYARNSRKHSAEQIEAIRRSIREFGWTMPILAREDGTVAAGHARLQAATLEGFTEAPVIVARGWTDEQFRLYVIADNRLSETSEWDDDILKAELGDLLAGGAEMVLTGFDDEALAAILNGGTVGRTDPDEAPEPPTVPVSQPGDLWVLGSHRILCGDCTKAGDVERVLDGATPRLMVTDPPYGVSYDPSWREGADLGIGKRSKGKVANDDRADWREAWQLFPGSIAYVWHGGLHSSVVQDSLKACGFEVRAQIVWVKQHFVLSRGNYHWQHEPCWYAVRGKGAWAGDRKQTTVWEIKNNNSFGNAEKEQTWGHGTQKPVECMRRPIENNSKRGDAVYEPFSGSGTTIIAAEMTGRACCAIEIDPAYIDVAVRRWQEFTGKKATLDGDGRAFEKVAAERGVKAAYTKSLKL